MKVPALIIIYLTLVTFFDVHSQHIELGLCPRLRPILNFNISAYKGDWFEVEKFWFLFEATAQCTQVHYYDDNGDNTFAVGIKFIEGITGREILNSGMTRFLSRDGSADLVLDLTINLSPVPFVVKYPYMVLDTDYISYTIKWSCSQVGPFNLQGLWILTRKPFYTPEVKRKVRKFLRIWGINTARLKPSDQSTCL